MKIVLSLVAIAGGVLTAIGVLVMLQQQGTVYPTRNVAILTVVLGVVWGVLLPSLAKTMRAASARR